MYSLLGLIHVLLVLTQSRFIPDLSMLFGEEKTATTAGVKSLAENTFQLPVERVADFSFELIGPRDKQKFKHSIQTNARYFLRIQKIKQRGRAMIGGKLYLLLGQLKTEG